MSTIIINLILQAIAGALGGNAAAAGLNQVDLGKAANTIAGAIGGRWPDLFGAASDTYGGCEWNRY